ncbi:hypothetical protein BD560DRAFT_412468 [Blakeslea trispora]|nr:hypothetical protein BD560DRAFT_412468 [Blakeslea trispora]
MKSPLFSDKHESLKQDQDADYEKKDKRFGSFMGKLLLKGGKKLVKKPASPVTRDKTLRQQSLTEEPFIRLFRARKGRESLFVSDSKLHPMESCNGIKFSLKSNHDPSQNFQDNNGVEIDTIADTKKRRTRDGRITRWDVMGSKQADELLSKTEVAEIENRNIEELSTPHEISPNEYSDSKESDTQSIISVSSELDAHSVESLQSDDDVLGPWIELGMIERTSMRTEDSSNLKSTNICDKCVTQDGNSPEFRTPFDTIKPCSDCTKQWNTLFHKISSQILKYADSKPHTNEQANEPQAQDENKSCRSATQNKKASGAPKKLSQSKPSQKLAIVPPTKSAYSIKTNIKMMTTLDKQENESKSSTDLHYTTGAFMTRKTAKVLADPKFGFYPNPYGLTHKQKVEVLNINGNWYSGTLEMMEKGKVKVRYDDWNDQEEWIVMGSKRLRQLPDEQETESASPEKQTDIKTPEHTNKIQSSKNSSSHANQSSSSRPKNDDYVSQTLDSNKTQIFNNNDIFMTRRLARELTDEHGFKPNSFGYRRNRAVSVTFFSKKKGERKTKDECIGYLREMQNDQVRVWYPEIHLSEWVPAGSRRLRLLSNKEEEVLLSENNVDFSIQEVPTNTTAKHAKSHNAKIDESQPHSVDNGCKPKAAPVHASKLKSDKNSSSVKEKLVSSENKKNSHYKSKTTNGTQISAEQSKSKSTEASANSTGKRKPIHDAQFLTTGAFATRRAMRQLKDDNGFVPNPYGYTYNQAVEVLNTRSGKAMFWERGTLIEMKTGKVKVHYDGWADIYDEWIMVGSRRIRIASSVEVSENSQKNDAAVANIDPDSVSHDSTPTPTSTDKKTTSDFLIAESNPEIRDEVKKNKKRQIIRPQDYHALGMLEKLDTKQQRKKGQQKEKAKEKMVERDYGSSTTDYNTFGSDHFDDNTCSSSLSCKGTTASAKRKKQPSTKPRKKRHTPSFVEEMSDSSNLSDASDSPETPDETPNEPHIISLRLAQARAPKAHKFVANVYGYTYMQHVTVLHLDKKLYEGRLVSMHKNKVRVHYCGWIDAFDEFIALGSRRIQPIDNDHEVLCIEPGYSERYEAMDHECTEVVSQVNQREPQKPLINRFSRKRITLADVESDENCSVAEQSNTNEVSTDTQNEVNEESRTKVCCNQCNVVIKQFRYYCTYCETSVEKQDNQGLDLCLRCFDQSFPFWHEHPRSGFAVQSVIDSAIGPKPIKGELVTIWEEDILDTSIPNDENPSSNIGGTNVEEEIPSLSVQSQPSVETSSKTDSLNGKENDADLATNASQVFKGDTTNQTDQGYKLLKKWRSRKVCAFCNDDEDNSEELGQFIGPFIISTFNKNGVEKKRSFWAHDSCARYSPEVFCTPEGKWYNVTLALRRGRGMRCHGCKEKGATIGCFDSKCNKSYHLPCAQKPVSYFRSGVIFWCSIHEAYYNKKDTYVNIFNCDGCTKKLTDESWFTCVSCASESYFQSFDLCAECFEKSPRSHEHNEDEFEETSFAILKEMEAQKAREAARIKEETRCANEAKKKRKPMFPRRRRKLADGTTPVSCCYCGTYDASAWRKGYDGGVIMCDSCFQLALLIDNDGNSYTLDSFDHEQDHYATSIDDYSHKPYFTRDTLSLTKFSQTSTGPRLSTYEPQPHQMFSLTFDSTYFDIPGRAPRWASHSGTDYHGTWLPQTVRRAILKYTSKDERVLSNFLGRGTDAIECFLLQRRCCGVDINPAAVSLSQRNCCFEVPPGLTSAEYRPIIAQADSRNLSGTLFSDESFHHVLSHPPYKDCVAYSTHLDGDLSRFTNMEDFKTEYTKVVQESWRLLKMSRRVTLGIGDNREHCFYIPVSFQLMRLYIDNGFELEELIVKRQRYCSAFGLGSVLCVQYDFLVFTHEFIATFRKIPQENIDRMLINDADGGLQEKANCRRTIRGVPSSAITRKSVVMGTVWVFKPTEEHQFKDLCVSRMVERFGKDDGNWEHIEFEFDSLTNEPSSTEKPHHMAKSQEETSSESNPLSEYERQRVERIQENNKTLLKLGLISELSEESEDVIHYENMMQIKPYENGSLVLMISNHLENLSPKCINEYRKSLVSLAEEALVKLAPKGMLIIGVKDIRDPFTGKLWPLTLLVQEDIEKNINRDQLRLKEMVVAVPEGFSKDRKQKYVEEEDQEEENEDTEIDIETVEHDHLPIVHTIYLVLQKM